MWKPSFSRGTLSVLLGTITLTSLAVYSNKIPASLSHQTATPVSTSKASKASPLVQEAQQSKAPNPYEKAIDIATGANTIAQSAVSRDDWSLVASRWQAAIKLLKAVPSNSHQYTTAQNKLSAYQNYLADALLRATPSPSPKACSDTNPDFFSVPIKDRVGRTPVVEVAFNGIQKFDMLFDTGASHSLITRSMAATLRLIPQGAGQAQIADGSVVLLPITKLKSAEIDGRLIRDMLVAVAPPSVTMGLLGQDFYKGYEVTIKDTAIEFRRSKALQKATVPKPCLVDINPQFFQVPIKTRKNGVPVVEVTFNDLYKFPMLFDTGADRTLITESMATQLKLRPVGRVAVEIADGSVVTLPVAVVKSNRINNRIKRDVLVSVAPATDMGLLGQDFFEGYDVTIKDLVIEFRRQPESL